MTFKRILCCVDFSSNSENAFKVAMDMAEKYGATLHLLHVLPPVVNPLITDINIAIPEASSTALVQKVEDRMQEVYAKKINPSMNHVISVKDGHVSSEILNYLLDETIDLVILGAYGLSGVELVLFGSVAKRIAHKAPCSVMIVREKK
ncbi:UspA2 [Desulforapulum autotrophicum HRM2]|uniref:Universal stress protein n=1 Tax=Desulforapulum autotrophicum (strain ATCC 43914 / DSM 3382 / VKM B-1955 / HRM2) TaxID=177437 RepID=C0QFZ2_DESAH|nr:universal stress protein [Desulforapulum autotrophicum]ACN15560.1 UspA2 [Desulforapulum autotrophicum HRM2]